MDREVAATEFARVLFKLGVERSLTVFSNCITRPTGKDREAWHRMQGWQESLDPKGRELFDFAVRKAMVLAVFAVATHLDGDSGYLPVDDRVGRLAVALNLYSTPEESFERSPEEVVQICPTLSGEDVHDIFMNL